MYWFKNACIRIILYIFCVFLVAAGLTLACYGFGTTFTYVHSDSNIELKEDYINNQYLTFYIFLPWGVFMSIIGFFGLIIISSLSCVCKVTCCH